MPQEEIFSSSILNYLSSILNTEETRSNTEVELETNSDLGFKSFESTPNTFDYTSVTMSHNSLDTQAESLQESIETFKIPTNVFKTPIYSSSTREFQTELKGQSTTAIPYALTEGGMSSAMNSLSSILNTEEARSYEQVELENSSDFDHKTFGSTSSIFDYTSMFYSQLSTKTENLQETIETSIITPNVSTMASFSGSTKELQTELEGEITLTRAYYEEAISTVGPSFTKPYAADVLFYLCSPCPKSVKTSTKEESPEPASENGITEISRHTSFDVKSKNAQRTKSTQVEHNNNFIAATDAKFLCEPCKKSKLFTNTESSDSLFTITEIDSMSSTKSKPGLKVTEKYNEADNSQTNVIGDFNSKINNTVLEEDDFKHIVEGELFHHIEIPPEERTKKTLVSSTTESTSTEINSEEEELKEITEDINLETSEPEPVREINKPTLMKLTQNTTPTRQDEMEKDTEENKRTSYESFNVTKDSLFTVKNGFKYAGITSTISFKDNYSVVTDGMQPKYNDLKYLCNHCPQANGNIKKTEMTSTERQVTTEPVFALEFSSEATVEASSSYFTQTGIGSIKTKSDNISKASKTTPSCTKPRGWTNSEEKNENLSNNYNKQDQTYLCDPCPQKSTAVSKELQHDTRLIESSSSTIKYRTIILQKGLEVQTRFEHGKETENNFKSDQRKYTTESLSDKTSTISSGISESLKTVKEEGVIKTTFLAEEGANMHPEPTTITASLHENKISTSSMYHQKHTLFATHNLDISLSSEVAGAPLDFETTACEFCHNTELSHIFQTESSTKGPHTEVISEKLTSISSLDKKVTKVTAQRSEEDKEQTETKKLTGSTVSAEQKYLEKTGKTLNPYKKDLTNVQTKLSFVSHLPTFALQKQELEQIYEGNKATWTVTMPIEAKEILTKYTEQTIYRKGGTKKYVDLESDHEETVSFTTTSKTTLEEEYEGIHPELEDRKEIFTTKTGLVRTKELEYTYLESQSTKKVEETDESKEMFSEETKSETLLINSKKMDELVTKSFKASSINFTPQATEEKAESSHLTNNDETYTVKYEGKQSVIMSTLLEASENVNESSFISITEPSKYVLSSTYENSLKASVGGETGETTIQYNTQALENISLASLGESEAAETSKTIQYDTEVSNNISSSSGSESEAVGSSKMVQYGTEVSEKISLASLAKSKAVKTEVSENISTVSMGESEAVETSETMTITKLQGEEKTDIFSAAISLEKTAGTIVMGEEHADKTETPKSLGMPEFDEDVTTPCEFCDAENSTDTRTQKSNSLKSETKKTSTAESEEKREELTEEPEELTTSLEDNEQTTSPDKSSEDAEAETTGSEGPNETTSQKVSESTESQEPGDSEETTATTGEGTEESSSLNEASENENSKISEETSADELSSTENDSEGATGTASDIVESSEEANVSSETTSMQNTGEESIETSTSIKTNEESISTDTKGNEEQSSLGETTETVESNIISKETTSAQNEGEESTETKTSLKTNEESVSTDTNGSEEPTSVGETTETVKSDIISKETTSEQNEGEESIETTTSLKTDEESVSTNTNGNEEPTSLGETTETVKSDISSEISSEQNEGEESIETTTSLKTDKESVSTDTNGSEEPTSLGETTETVKSDISSETTSEQNEVEGSIETTIGLKTSEESISASKSTESRKVETNESSEANGSSISESQSETVEETSTDNENETHEGMESSGATSTQISIEERNESTTSSGATEGVTGESEINTSNAGEESTSPSDEIEKSISPGVTNANGENTKSLPEKTTKEEHEITTLTGTQESSEPPSSDETTSIKVTSEELNESSAQNKHNKETTLAQSSENESTLEQRNNSETTSMAEAKESSKTHISIESTTSTVNEETSETTVKETPTMETPILEEEGANVHLELTTKTETKSLHENKISTSSMYHQKHTLIANHNLDISLSSEVAGAPLDFETTACEFCHNTELSHTYLTESSTKAPQTEVISEKLTSVSSIDKKHTKVTAQRSEILSTSEVQNDFMEFKTTPCVYCHTEKQEQDTEGLNTNSHKESIITKPTEEDKEQTETKKPTGATVSEENKAQTSTKQHSSTQQVSQKPVVIIVNNSKGKHQKLNRTFLEDLISTPIPDVELHYVDLNSEEDVNLVNPPSTSKKSLKIDMPYQGCKKTDFENENNCFCNIQNYLDTLMKKINKKETVKSKENYCESFFRLKTGLLIQNSVKPVIRKRRGLIYMDNLRQRGEILQFDNIEGLFESNFKLTSTDKSLFCLPSETIRIPCTKHSNNPNQEDKVMRWTYYPLASSKGELLPDKGQELVLHGTSVKKAGNYTCSPESEESTSKKQHWHELELINFPVYQINMNIFYKINVSCNLQTGDALYAYLPKIVSPILCSNENEVCSIKMDRPRCLTREDDNYFNVTIKATMKSDFVQPLHNQCDINCKLRVYENVVNIVYKNSEIIDHIPVYSQLDRSRDIAFIPHSNGKEDSPVYIKSPRIVVSCPAGFGLESRKQRVCVVCPPQTSSNDEEAYCKGCPAGHYQPDPGSKSCLQCNSPVDDKMCLRMLYTDTKLFKIYVVVAFGFIVLMVILIIVWTSGFKDQSQVDNRYYEGSLRHRADIKRKDMDLEVGANEPLLRHSPHRFPPQLPPVDF